AGITVFFAILIAVSGAISYFLQHWSIPFLVVLIVALNILYSYNIIDPSNRAYGLNYANKESRPEYSRQTLLELCSEDNMARDKRNMIEILERWKRKQKTGKPLLYI